MPRCVSCGTVPQDSPILDAFYCSDCRTTWCQTCATAEVRCPQCAGMRVLSFTLTDDAYL